MKRTNIKTIKELKDKLNIKGDVHYGDYFYERLQVVVSYDQFSIVIGYEQDDEIWVDEGVIFELSSLVSTMRNCNIPNLVAIYFTINSTGYSATACVNEDEITFTSDNIQGVIQALSTNQN